MKKFLAGLGILSLVLLAAGPVLAQEASVSATVTVKLIAVSVDPISVNYGVLSFGESKSSSELDPTVNFIATNDGNVTVDFNVRGTDATGVAWTLGATSGTDIFKHTVTGTSPVITEQSLTLSSASWKADVANGGTQAFDSKFYMPSGGVGAGEEASTSITIIAVE